MPSLSSGKQLTLFVTFFIQPDKAEEWKAAHRPVWAICAADPKCLLFDIFTEQPSNSAEQADTLAKKAGVQTEPEYIRFRLVEVWDADKAWIENELLPKPEYQALWKRSRPTWAKEVEIEWFERIGEGCSYEQQYLEGGKTMS